MGKFKKYLSEIKKSEILKNTDKGRIKRGTKEMRTQPPKVTVLDNGWERYDYNVKSSPPEKSTEKKNHRGYIIIDPKTGEIKEAFCDCLDFAYRLRSPYVKAEIAKWKLDKKYKKREPFEHNKQPTKITNPSNLKYACKHLTAIFKNYLSDIPN